MERGNTKHGPIRDDEMAHEIQGMVRGAAQRPHQEEWRQTEPVEDAIPPGAGRRPADSAVAARSELARVVTRDVFPADRQALERKVADSDAAPGLADRLAELPAGRSFGSVHEVLEALGITSPEGTQAPRNLRQVD